MPTTAQELAQELVQEARRDCLRAFMRRNELLLEGLGLYREDGFDRLLLVAGWLDDPSEQSEPFAHCPRYAAVYSYDPDGRDLDLTQVALCETREEACQRLEQVIAEGSYKPDYIIDLDSDQRLEVTIHVTCAGPPSG